MAQSGSRLGAKLIALGVNQAHRGLVNEDDSEEGDARRLRTDLAKTILAATAFTLAVWLVTRLVLDWLWPLTP